MPNKLLKNKFYLTLTFSFLGLVFFTNQANAATCTPPSVSFTMPSSVNAGSPLAFTIKGTSAGGVTVIKLTSNKGYQAQLIGDASTANQCPWTSDLTKTNSCVFSGSDTNTNYPNGTTITYTAVVTNISNCQSTSIKTVTIGAIPCTSSGQSCTPASLPTNVTTCNGNQTQVCVNGKLGAWSTCAVTSCTCETGYQWDGVSKSCASIGDACPSDSSVSSKKAVSGKKTTPKVCTPKKLPINATSCEATTCESGCQINSCVCKSGFSWDGGSKQCVVLLPTADIKVNGLDGPITVPYSSANTPVNLSWTSTNAVSCTLSYSKPTVEVETSGATQVSVKSSDAFTLSCVNVNGISAEDEVIINVEFAPEYGNLEKVKNVMDSLKGFGVDDEKIQSVISKAMINGIPMADLANILNNIGRVGTKASQDPVGTLSIYMVAYKNALNPSLSEQDKAFFKKVADDINSGNLLLVQPINTFSIEEWNSLNPIIAGLLQGDKTDAQIAGKTFFDKAGSAVKDWASKPMNWIQAGGAIAAAVPTFGASLIVPATTLSGAVIAAGTNSGNKMDVEMQGKYIQQIALVAKEDADTALIIRGNYVATQKGYLTLNSDGIYIFNNLQGSNNLFGNGPTPAEKSTTLAMQSAIIYAASKNIDNGHNNFNKIMIGGVDISTLSDSDAKNKINNLGAIKNNALASFPANDSTVLSGNGIIGLSPGK